MQHVWEAFTGPECLIQVLIFKKKWFRLTEILRKEDNYIFSIALHCLSEE